MRKLNPRYAEEVSSATNQCPYFQLQSMRIVELGVGWSVLEIVLAEKHLQPFGQVHGGVLSTIIDAASFWAVFTELDDDLGMTTVDLKLNYLAPPSSTGKLIARGRRIKLGRTLGLADAEVTDQGGKIVAHGTSTVMIVPGLGFKSQNTLPPKFIEEDQP